MERREQKPQTGLAGIIDHFHPGKKLRQQLRHEAFGAGLANAPLHFALHIAIVESGPPGKPVKGWSYCTRHAGKSRAGSQLFGFRVSHTKIRTKLNLRIDTTEHRNHLGTLHAGALFTLGETASGAAIAGAIAPILQDAKPLAKTARIEYLRPARGEITATATIPDPSALQARVSSNGRVSVLASVRLHDATGAEVARIEVDWIVIGRRSSNT
jgi:acyl-coenzyme A thioesterase PaaI-like protein